MSTSGTSTIASVASGGLVVMTALASMRPLPGRSTAYPRLRRGLAHPIPACDRGNDRVRASACCCGLALLKVLDADRRLLRGRLEATRDPRLHLRHQHVI